MSFQVGEHIPVVGRWHNKREHESSHQPPLLTPIPYNLPCASVGEPSYLFGMQSILN